MNIVCTSGDLVCFTLPMPRDGDEALAGQQVLRCCLLLGKSTAFAISGSRSGSPSVDLVASRCEDRCRAAAWMLYNAKVTVVKRV